MELHKLPPTSPYPLLSLEIPSHIMQGSGEVTTFMQVDFVLADWNSAIESSSSWIFRLLITHSLPLLCTWTNQFNYSTTRQSSKGQLACISTSMNLTCIKQYLHANPLCLRFYLLRTATNYKMNFYLPIWAPCVFLLLENYLPLGIINMLLCKWTAGHMHDCMCTLGL